MSNPSKYIQEAIIRMRDKPPGEMGAVREFNSCYHFLETIGKLGLVGSVVGQSAMSKLSWRDVDSFMETL